MIMLIFAGLTIATLLALLFPLLRPCTAPAPLRTEYEIGVYRDQLVGLNDEIERGLITPDQADAARLEIQRRILGAAENTGGDAALDNQRLNRIVALVIVLLISIGSWQLYAYLGEPHMPDRPFAARQNDPDMQMNATAEIIAAELEVYPDAGGYRRLAEMFYTLHRFDRATEACRKAIDLGQNDAETWSRLGESIVMANNGMVVMDAQNAFKTSLTRDKNEPRARFYIGLAEAQIGELNKAVAIWRDIEKTAPPNAPWLPMVKDNIAFYAKQGGFDPASVTPASPD